MSSVPAKNPPVVPAKPPQHETAFIAAFVKATVDTLSVQCGTKVVAGTPVSKGAHEDEGSEVIVIGGIVGTDIDCSVSFCFSETACAVLIGSMLQKKVKLGGEQVMAAASEMVRIIGFQAKKLLNDRGYKVEAVFPRVVLDGKDVRIWADKMRDGIVVPFSTARGDRFTLEIL